MKRKSVTKLTALALTAAMSMSLLAGCGNGGAMTDQAPVRTHSREHNSRVRIRNQNRKPKRREEAAIRTLPA